MIEVEVNSIRVSLMSQHRVVLLKDINTERYLPIFIGQYEADAISIELQDKRAHDRPLTHDLLKNLIENLDGEVVHILINDMRRDIYFARIVVEVNGEQREIDSRPSDAIALAVRTKSPIFISEAVMERSGVEPDEEIELTDEPKQLPFNRSEPARDIPEELLDDPIADAEPVADNEFSAFADFVNSLDLDELDDSEEN
ncbi:MAG: bifunctional nuclease family protein [Phototrophicaceae bacterium]